MCALSSPLAVVSYPEAQRVAGIHRLAVGAAVHSMQAVAPGEAGNVLGPGRDVVAVAMNQEQRRALAVGLVVQLHAAYRLVVSGGGVGAVGRGGFLGRGGEVVEVNTKKNNIFFMADRYPATM